MKTLSKIFSLLILIATISSCQFTEQINFHENGSGTYTLKVDMTTMMQTMKKMGDSTNLQKENPKIIDSIISFENFLVDKKDSISKLPIEEQEKLKALKDMKMRIQVNEETDAFVMDFIFDFNNISELDRIQEKISKGQSINKKNTPPSPEAPTEVVYSFDGKKFKRKVIDKNLSEEAKKVYKTSMLQSASMMEGSSYNIEYNFPKPIKSTTFKEATFSADRKTLYIKSDLNTITSNPNLLDFEVILK